MTKITIDQLNKECPLEYLNDIDIGIITPSSYYIKSEVVFTDPEISAWYKSILTNWNTKNYISFLVMFGVLFEKYLSHIILLSTIKFQQSASKKYKYSPNRKKCVQDLSTIIKKISLVENQNNFSFYNKKNINKHGLSEAELFQLLIVSLFDDDIIKLFIKRLNRLESIRNSMCHGNVPELWQKMFPTAQIPMTKFNLYTGEIMETKNENISEALSLVPFILLFDAKGNLQKQYELEIKEIFIQLTYLMSMLERTTGKEFFWLDILNNAK